MSGYFLAMVARCQPRWVLRENVLAPDVIEFEAALQVLGYYCILVEANSAAFTGQSRRREFVVGFDTQKAAQLFEAMVFRQINEDDLSQCSAKQQSLKCLNSRGRSGIGVYQDYVYEGPKRGFRSFSHAERESLQGWPIGGTDGLPHSARERITGNGVTAPVAEWLGKRIFVANR